jgi:hypothetical protein
MTPAEVLRKLSQRGVILEPHGDKPQYRAPQGMLTPELRQPLAEQKAAIVPECQRMEANTDTPILAGTGRSGRGTDAFHGGLSHV